MVGFRKHSIDEKYRKFLKCVPLLADFTDHSLEFLMQNVQERNYEKGKILFFSGDPVHYIYIIEKGWIKLFRETQDGHESVLALLTQGDTFGEAAVLVENNHSYSCEIIVDTTLLQIPISHIKKMLHSTEHCHDLCTKLLEIEIHNTNQRCLEVEHLTTMTSAQRIGCFLLKGCGHIHEGSFKLELPVDKYLVAGRLGMTPETFSRGLNQLSAIGVETKNSEVTINNIEQLRSHVCRCCSALAGECDFLDDE